MYERFLISRNRAGLSAIAFILFFGVEPASFAEAGSLIHAKCLKCHSEFKEMKDVAAGDFASLSNKAKSFQVDVGEAQQIIRFTADTQVANVEKIKDLKKPIPVLVEYEKEGSDLVATRITAKPVIKVAEENLMGAEELNALVAQGPETGKYTLIDSRPPIRYQEGHIPTAVSMPFGKMPSMMDRLPQDKDSLLVFYCGGFR
jgi:hypothetical protein